MLARDEPARVLDELREWLVTGEGATTSSWIGLATPAGSRSVGGVGVTSATGSAGAGGGGGVVDAGGDEQPTAITSNHGRVTTHGGYYCSSPGAAMAAQPGGCTCAASGGSRARWVGGIRSGP